jgi:hypothetical protein
MVEEKSRILALAVPYLGKESSQTGEMVPRVFKPSLFQRLVARNHDASNVTRLTSNSALPTNHDYKAGVSNNKHFHKFPLANSAFEVCIKKMFASIVTVWPVAAVVGVLLIVFRQLFVSGPLFSGDFTSASTLDPLYYGGNPFASFVGFRNAGYSSVASPFRWANLPQWVLLWLPGEISGNFDFSKVGIAIYFLLASLGMFTLLKQFGTLDGRSTESGWKILLIVVLSLGYAVNPDSIQSVLKGYVGVLAVSAFLPWLILTYQWLCRASNVRQILARSSLVSLLGFLTVTYSYSAVMVCVALLSVELAARVHDQSFQLRAAFMRIGLVASIFIAFELPTVYLFMLPSTRQYLAGGGNYAAAGADASLQSALTMTGGAYVPPYVVQALPFPTLVFQITLLASIIGVFGLLLLGKLKQAQTIGLLTFTVGIILSSGPIFLLNVWVNSVFPAFIEAWEFFPLVALGFAIMAGVTLLNGASRCNSRVPYIVKGVKRGRREISRRHYADWVVAMLVVSSAMVSISMANVAFQTYLEPAKIPANDNNAYNWVKYHANAGRMLLIPPSYSNTYSYSQQSYAGPADYWTLNPPEPIISGSDSGSLNGLNVAMATAFYTGNSQLFSYTLSALNISYVVVQTGALTTWDVPYYHPVNASYMSTYFPYLKLAAQFGQTLIYHYADSYMFMATSYPIVMYCPTGVEASLLKLSEIISAESPIVSVPCGHQIPTSINRLRGVPVLNLSGGTLPTVSSSYVAASLLNVPDLGTFLPPSGTSLQVWAPNAANISLLTNPQVDYSYSDNFNSNAAFRGSWSTFDDSGPSVTSWSIKNSSLFSNGSDFQPIALLRQAVSLGGQVFSVSVNLSMASGFGAGICMASNLSNPYSDQGLQVFVVPSWGYLFASYIQSGIVHSYVYKSPNMPLLYNKTYRLSVNFVGNQFSASVNNLGSLNGTVNWSGRFYAGLFTTQAPTTFSNFSVSSSKVNDVQPSVVIPLNTTYSEFDFPINGAPIPTVLSYAYQPAATFVTDSNLNIYSLLHPAIVSLNPEAEGSNSWRFAIPAYTSLFITTSIFNDGLWQLSDSGEIITTNSYAVGFVWSQNVTLSHSKTYTFMVEVALPVVAGSILFNVVSFSLDKPYWKRGKVGRV